MAALVRHDTAPASTGFLSVNCDQSAFTHSEGPDRTLVGPADADEVVGLYDILDPATEQDNSCTVRLRASDWGKMRKNWWRRPARAHSKLCFTTSAVSCTRAQTRLRSSAGKRTVSN